MDKNKLLDMLKTSFDESELRDLCFTLDVEYQDLPGDSRADKARELIRYLERRERLADLLHICRQLRPHMAWPQANAPAAGHARAQKQQMLAELLTPMLLQLERTQQAFERWRAQNLYLEAEIIFKGNLAVRDLLIAKAHLIPPDLVQDAKRLIVHYDRWLEEYHRVRGSQQPDLDAPFVFAGPAGHPFPRAAEARFRARFAQLQRELADKE